MQTVRRVILDPLKGIERDLRKWGCSRAQIQRHLTSLQHQQERRLRCPSRRPEREEEEEERQ
jgi:hypothetical protein